MHYAAHGAIELTSPASVSQYIVPQAWVVRNSFLDSTTSLTGERQCTCCGKRIVELKKTFGVGLRVVPYPAAKGERGKLRPERLENGILL